MDDQGHAHGIWHGRIGGHFFHFLFFSFLFSTSSCCFCYLYCCIVITGVWVGSASLHYQYGVGSGAAFWLFLWVSQERRTGWGTERERASETGGLVSSVSCLYYT
jgi:hypothetical protein